MSELSAYLSDSLGLSFTEEEWAVPPEVPLFLRRSAEFVFCKGADVDYVAAWPKDEPTLPELKRIYAQLLRYVDTPVVLVSSSIDSRQRKALVSQGIPFVVPGKQAYLPFLGFAATRAREERKLGDTLSPAAQSALVSLLANPVAESMSQLCCNSRMSRSTASRGIEELAQRGLIERSKRGRDVVFSYERGHNALLHKAMPYVISPVVKSVFVTRTPEVDALVDAGESALASRSMLGKPHVAQKAVYAIGRGRYDLQEVLEGELPDDETVEVQFWRYAPLVAGGETVDDVSLALSLAPLRDERINGELDELFGEEGLWQ